MPDALIEVSGLQRLAGKKPVLRDVALRLEAGSTLGLIGRNGAGKTTLLRCMLGLAFPDAGEVRVFGERAAELSAQAKARIGYVAQSADLPSVYQVGPLLALVVGWQPRWDATWAAELLRRFDLPLNVGIGKLSVGQRQLLALVLAIGHKPALLVLDEPVASLDPVARRDVVAALAELQAECGTSIVFSTHSLSDLERLATHIAVLSEGVIAFECEADAIKQDIARWQIESASALPATLTLDGVLSYRLLDARTAVAVADTRRISLPALRERLQASIDSRPLCLEDFMVEYLR